MEFWYYSVGGRLITFITVDFVKKLVHEQTSKSVYLNCVCGVS